jgi:hypothetical protein
MELMEELQKKVENYRNETGKSKEKGYLNIVIIDQNQCRAIQKYWFCYFFYVWSECWLCLIIFLVLLFSNPPSFLNFSKEPPPGLWSQYNNSFVKKTLFGFVIFL